MKVLLAVSADGFVAKHGRDDMSWTGKQDKQLFRLLTNLDDEPLAVGAATLPLMPALKGRRIIGLSRTPNSRGRGGYHIEDWMTLLELERWFPKAWVIGGQSVALEAVRAGYVDRVVLSRVQTLLDVGIALSPELRDFGTRVCLAQFSETVVELRQRVKV